MIDLLNDFTLGGGTDADLRKFVIERSGYDDGYDPLADCRNPDLTEAQYMSSCTWWVASSSEKSHLSILQGGFFIGRGLGAVIRFLGKAHFG